MTAPLPRVLGFIGGSGLYDVADLEDRESVDISSPWGEPSAPIIKGRLNGVPVLFLARHGEGHKIPPHGINYRANIHALKAAGATDLVSISSCGSFREDLPPGTFVAVDQFIDRTTGRAKTFFDDGFVAHVSMADPVCPTLQDSLAAACDAIGVAAQKSGTYLCIDGPQFSSRAESHMYRAWGADVIGMTNLPEAKLAREAELPYATLAMVTDYDCWRENDKAVEVTDVLAVMRRNGENAVKLIDVVTKALGPTRTLSPLGVETVLDFAVITAPGARDPAMIEKLSVVAGRYLAANE